MKEFLCWLGIHNWGESTLLNKGGMYSTHSWMPTGEEWFQYKRECEHCHKVDVYTTH